MSTSEALKCPVCDWEITNVGIKIKVDGRDITVCCDECAQKLKDDSSAGKGDAVDKH